VGAFTLCEPNRDTKESPVRTKILSALFCGVAALALSACDEEPVVESAPAPATVTVEDVPACCSVDGDAAAEATADCEGVSECETMSDCETMSECGIEDVDCEVTDCTPEELEQCKEKGVCPTEKSPEKSPE